MLGVPTLVGLGFILTTTGDATPPLAPGWPTEWHEHSGLIDDESVGRGSRGPGRGTRRSTRVWVLHIWNAVGNPAGRYVADNWALPFARAGLVPPAEAEPEAGRAFSLAVGGDAFFVAMLADAGFMRESATRQVIEALVAAALADAREVARRAASRESREISGDDVARLRTTWRTLERGLVAALGSHVARYLGSAAHH